MSATETVRGTETKLHLTFREYLADDMNVKRNYSSPWYKARGYVSQPIPVKHGQRIAHRVVTCGSQSTRACYSCGLIASKYESPESFSLAFRLILLARMMEPGGNFPGLFLPCLFRSVIFFRQQNFKKAIFQIHRLGRARDLHTLVEKTDIDRDFVCVGRHWRNEPVEFRRRRSQQE